ncbi:MFS general substrate transporter [Macrolepiota fuliginosa MF-IS2]|uniref:MFS general substrate transporter n=1 Tax=Macrolepiota fuliginosa MF-IS2 TaxID=1400762 RepID=A0A9P5X7K7_9AGAR|nr:MFS general substrate transporter [Macrolepiota fuliginosa MF-IS2]
MLEAHDTHSSSQPDTPTPTNTTTTANDQHQPPKKHKRNEIQLTDQTNLLPFKKVLATFMGLSICIVVSVLDSVSVATALPTISGAFNAGSIVSWVPSAYLLTSTAFQPIYGRFSDIFGRKATLTAAMAIFMTGNLAAGFSKSIVQLIVFRGIAGSGGGAILSLGQIIITDIITLRDRGKYQGILGGVVAVGYTIGPIIGGALAQQASWRWCFWMSVPLGLFAVTAVNYILPLKPVQGEMRKKLLVVDYVGCMLTLTGCTLIILPLIWGGITFPWKSAVVLAPLICGVFTCVLFVLWEWKGARLPIVPLRIFKHSTVCGVYITMFINGLITFSAMFYLPQFFQAVLNYTAIHAGLFLIPLLAGQVVVSWIAGLTVSRTGRYRTIVHSGFAIWSLACGLISTITPRTKPGVMVVFMLLSGVGSGQTLQTTTVAAQASVPRKDMSVVTAFRNFVRMLGGTLALAVGATLINNTLRSSMQSLSLPEEVIKRVIDDPSLLSNPSSINISVEQAMTILDQGYTKGFRSVFILNASLSAVATVASILLIKHKDLTRDDDAKLREKGREQSSDAEKGGVSDGVEKPGDEKEKFEESIMTTDHELAETTGLDGKASTEDSGTLSRNETTKGAEGGRDAIKTA